jgi:hypothetical protein
MDDNRIARLIEKWEPIGKKTRGQQRQRWKDATIGEVRLRGAKGRNIQELAKDRELWKNFHRLQGRIAENSVERDN